MDLTTHGTDHYWRRQRQVPKLIVKWLGRHTTLLVLEQFFRSHKVLASMHGSMICRASIDIPVRLPSLGILASQNGQSQSWFLEIKFFIKMFKRQLDVHCPTFNCEIFVSLFWSTIVSVLHRNIASINKNDSLFRFLRFDFWSLYIVCTWSWWLDCGCVWFNHSLFRLLAIRLSSEFSWLLFLPSCDAEFLSCDGSWWFNSWCLWCFRCWCPWQSLWWNKF